MIHLIVPRTIDNQAGPLNCLRCGAAVYGPSGEQLMVTTDFTADQDTWTGGDGGINPPCVTP